MTGSISGSRSCPPPRFATRRSSAPTLGNQVAEVARLLGIELQPWQQLVADVVCEVNEDGGWRYPKVVLTVPRQCGKSTLVSALALHRTLTMKDSRTWYTSSTGLAARDQFHEVVRRVQHAAPDRFKFRMGAGTEQATYPPTESVIRVFPPTPESLHGRQGDLIVLDEVWSFTTEQGGNLLQATVPTMATRGGRAQLVLTSTAGSDDSWWFRGEVDAGRAAVSDPDARVAYFEWSAPDGVDPFDEVSWPDWHPSLGQTITVDAMRNALEVMGEKEFRRAYANTWPDPDASWRMQWPICRSDDLIDPTARVVFGVDASPGQDRASIVAAGPTVGGSMGLEVVDHRDGIRWLHEAVVGLSRRQGGEVVIARTGPVGYLLEDLRRAGVNVIPATTGDYGDAISRIQTMTVEHQLVHNGDPVLAAAVANTRTMPGERPFWRRRDATTDISSAVAAALALHRACNPVGIQIF